MSRQQHCLSKPPSHSPRSRGSSRSRKIPSKSALSLLSLHPLRALLTPTPFALSIPTPTMHFYLVLSPNLAHFGDVVRVRGHNATEDAFLFPPSLPPSASAHPYQRPPHLSFHPVQQMFQAKAKSAEQSLHRSSETLLRCVTMAFACLERTANPQYICGSIAEKLDLGTAQD